MKQAIFITSPSCKVVAVHIPHDPVNFNRRDLSLEPHEGILNVKKEFSVGERVDKVILRATAAGVFRLYLNGNRVGQEIDGKMVYDEMKPGWTDYRLRVFEFEYDITSLCKERNVFVADVASGWWNGRISFGAYGSQPCAFAGEIEVIYKDGRTEMIASDETWEAMTGGPIRRADIWDGQYDDATLPHPSIAPEAYVWENAIAFHAFYGKIVPAVGSPVRVREHLNRHPMTAVVYEGSVSDGSELGSIHVRSKSVGAGCEAGVLKAGQALILDMGQEMVGRPSLTVTASRGTKMEVFFAELLNDSGEGSRGNDGPKGSPYLKNYRTALSRYVCVLSGDGKENHAPSHVFYGFRYLEIRADRDMEIHSVIGEVIGSALSETSTFVCDNPEVNQLYSNALWGMRGNYLSIPTDCPQRDERLGWTGDTQIFCGAASYLADIRDFMHKWLGDARDSQVAFDGAYCDVIPRVYFYNGGDANAAWGDAGLIVPYRLWLMYRDEAVIAEHYESMEWYMRYLEQFGLDGPRPRFGDWLNYDVTEPAYISVCYYAYDAYLMEKFSTILGKEERSAYYRDLHKKIVAHWIEKYTNHGDLTIHTQTAYLLPLAFDMVPEAWYTAFVEKLRESIVQNEYTLSTGFVGTGILCQTLAKCGLHDLCYSLLLQTKDPSWLYSIRQGATTMWERWNSYTQATGFGDVSMNSFNHYAYGAVAEWLFGGMCGILPDSNNPGFKHFLLSPTPDMRKTLPEGQRRIGSAKATYCSQGGLIESGWSYANGEYTYNFVIPKGTTAEVRLVSEKDVVWFNGLEISASELSAQRQGERLIFTLSEGAYYVKIDS